MDEELIKIHAMMISKYTKELYSKGKQNHDTNELQIAIHNHVMSILNHLEIDHNIKPPKEWK